MTLGEEERKVFIGGDVGDKNREKACGNGGGGRTKKEEIQRRGGVDFSFTNLKLIRKMGKFELEKNSARSLSIYG